MLSMKRSGCLLECRKVLGSILEVNGTNFFLAKRAAKSDMTGFSLRPNLVPQINLFGLIGRVIKIRSKQIYRNGRSLKFC